jgi:MYXO-CTERM domain-containing protein
LLYSEMMFRLLQSPLLVLLLATGCGGSLDTTAAFDPYGKGDGEGGVQPIAIDSASWIVGVGFFQVAEKDNFGTPIVYDRSTNTAAPSLFVRVTINGMQAEVSAAAPGYQASLSPHEEGRLLSSVPGAVLRSMWRFEVFDRQTNGPFLIADCTVELSPAELHGLSVGDPLVRRRQSDCASANSDEQRQLERIEFHVIQDTSTPTTQPPTQQTTTQQPVDPQTQPTAGPQSPGQPEPGQTPAGPATGPADPSAPAPAPSAPSSYPPASSEAVSGCGVAGAPGSPPALLLLVVAFCLRRRRK